MTPCMAAANRRFSAPVSSGWNPTPTSICAVTRPRTRTVPVVGDVTPATIFARVDFPAPL
jgi:hypothetical protein